MIKINMFFFFVRVFSKINSYAFQLSIFNPYDRLLERFAKNMCFGHSGGFRLVLGQISLNLVENALAIQQLALLATSIAFYDILART